MKTVSIVIVEQYLDRCRGNPFTEQLPSDSPGIVDVFTGRYLETDVCLSAYCIATAVYMKLDVRHVCYKLLPCVSSIRCNSYEGTHYVRP
jgi:hypothetical protein